MTICDFNESKIVFTHVPNMIFIKAISPILTVYDKIV